MNGKQDGGIRERRWSHIGVVLVSLSGLKCGYTVGKMRDNALSGVESNIGVTWLTRLWSQLVSAENASQL